MSLNASEPSAFAESIFEDSTLNNGIISSNLDLSKKTTEESLMQNNSKLESFSTELSITLDQKEREILQRNQNGHSSLLHTAENTRNDCSETTTNTMKDTSAHEVNTEDLEDNEEVDESVIPIEDDDVMEISALESPGVETPQEDMFSHLQPNKNATVFDQMDIEREDECKLFQHSFVEVGRRLWPSTAEKQLYTKGCLWSPDGTCLLVPVHLDGMHVVELPTDLYTVSELQDNRDLSNLVSAVHVKEGGTVYDCCWYPYMNSSDPATCCWLATRQHEPIHMWDAFSGELRCSYRGYDDVDEVESAISIIFSNDGQKVIGGYKKTIKIFDTNIPGRACSSIGVKKAASCFALTTENDNCVTAGNWAGYINHYDLRAPKLGPLFTLGGHSGGITLLKYSPTADQNWYLFSGARKDNKILQWDMRNYTEPIQVFERNVQTNQRIYYDLTPLNTWLASGDTEGLLRIWNLGDKDQQFELPLHQDCCNGVSFHPSLPLISTSSGQYHFVDDTETEDTSLEKIVNYENSLLIFWYGPLKEN